MQGNDEVNETKLEKVLGNIRPAHPDELKEITGADAGSIGPIGFKGKIIADLRLKDRNNLFSGANKNDYHIGGIDLKRDVPHIQYADLRIVQSGEGCPKCDKILEVFPAIELGHIFKLGTKYSEAMKALFLDESGKEKPIIMGSYGIGVERVIACFIEQNHDARGIVWNKVLAPFQIHLISINPKNEKIAETCEKVYNELKQNGIEVLYDDRDASPGFKFNDADLLGMPLQIVIGEKKLKENKVEVKIRKTDERFDVALEELTQKAMEIIEKL
jgi:prolyl-tRNA synthetase